MLPTWLKWTLTLGGAGLVGFAGYKIYESKKPSPEPASTSKLGTWLDDQHYQDKRGQIWAVSLVGGAWEASSPMYGEVLHEAAGTGSHHENLKTKIDAYVAINKPGELVKVPPPPKSWEIPAIFGKCMDPSQGGGTGCAWIPGYVQPMGWKPPVITSEMTLEQVISSFMKSNSDWKPPAGWVPGMPIPAGYPAPKDWNPAVIPTEEILKDFALDPSSKGEARVGQTMVMTGPRGRRRPQILEASPSRRRIR